MPVLTSEYSPPFVFKYGHVSTVYYGLFRTISGLEQKRERLELADGDFIDLDWSFAAGGTDTAWKATDKGPISRAAPNILMKGDTIVVR